MSVNLLKNLNFAEKINGTEAVTEAGKEIFGYTGDLKFGTSDDKDYLKNNPNRRCPVIDKARDLLGYTPQVDVRQGVRYFLEYIKESEEDELIW